MKFIIANFCCQSFHVKLMLYHKSDDLFSINLLVNVDKEQPATDIINISEL